LASSDDKDEDFIATGESVSFVERPSKKSRPAGREAAKCSDAVKFVIDKVVQQTTSSLQNINSDRAPLWGTLEKSLLETNNQMRVIVKQQALMANHQVMMQAPDELRQKYFDEIYALNILVASNNCLEEETRQVELCARKAIADKKLAECNVLMEGSDGEDNGEENESVSVSKVLKDPEVYLTLLCNTPHWVELACKGEICADDLVNSLRGNEFACLHNRDSMDFMNEAKFERFILKRTNDTVPFSWDLLGN